MSDKFFYTGLALTATILWCALMLVVSIISMILSFLGLGFLMPVLSLFIGFSFIIGMWNKEVRFAMEYLMHLWYALFKKGPVPAARYVF